MQISVKADVKAARLFFQNVSKKAIPKATARALNRAIDTVKTQAARDIRQKRDVKISEIKKAMKVNRASQKPGPYYLKAELTVTGASIPLRHFAKAGARGVTVRVEPGSKRTRVEWRGQKAFINDKWPKSGGNVFVRRTRKRLPIQKLPPVSGFHKVFLQERIIQGLKTLGVKTFKARLDHELQREIDREAAASARG